MGLRIPYFTFREIPSENSILLRIYADKVQFGELHFQIIENRISVFSSKYQERCVAQIRLPANASKLASEEVYDDAEESLLRTHRLLFQKSENNVSSDTSSCGDLDIISKYLSWNCNYEEEPFTVSAYQPNLDDDLSESLLKKLLFNESNESSLEDTKVCIGFYGFASKYKDVLTNFEVNWRNVIDCDNPNTSDHKTRQQARWENERQCFDVDHYLADYFFENADEACSTVMLYECLKYQPYWERIKSPDERILTSNQMDILASLPCKNFSLIPTERLEVLHSLFDIILAFAYDNRLNNGVYNSESSWNISRLSSTLSWLQAYKHPRDVIISFFRRSLTFPLVRHLTLSRKVLQDALAIFHLGRRQLLNCLVSLYELFDNDNDRKIFNKLYMEDYLIWIQQVHPQTLKNYTRFIETSELVHKRDIFPTLPSIESAAIELLQEDQHEYEEWYHRSKEVKSFIYSGDSEKFSGECS